MTLIINNELHTKLNRGKCMIEYDVKAMITNKRETHSSFKSCYRPTFAIHKKYNTSGEITLIDCEWLSYDETSEAFIRFLSPEVYPKSIWIGKEIVFMEGPRVTGIARIIEIYNSVLKSDIDGVEGELVLAKPVNKRERV